MASKGASAATGAMSGAAAGAALGPWGAAGGAVLGGVAGYLTGDDGGDAPTYTPDRANFRYGLGDSGSYASLQSEKYDQAQAGLGALAADGYNRQAPTMGMPTRRDYVQSDGMSYLQGADADARRRQLEALGGIQQSNAALNRFAQAPMGPSAAQAQLQAGTDAAARQQYGMARTQPGGGGAALRNAAFNAAGISGNAANSAAMLRAQETAQHRSQQLQALGAVQQGAGTMAGYTGQLRGADQGFAQAQAGQANFASQGLNQFNQQQQQLEFGVGQSNQNAALQQGRQNDALTLGALGMSQSYEGLRNQNAAANSNMGVAYEAARAQGAGVGVNATQVNNAQSNAELGMVLGAGSAAAGAYGQIAGPNNPQPQQPNPTSDIRAKTDIRPVSVLGSYERDRSEADLQNVREQVQSAQATRMGPDTNMREFGMNQDRQARLQALLGPRPDLRPAQGYEYAYTDPERHGEGRYVGPMAQDLEHLPGVVEQGPDGMKSVNAPRLTMALAPAVGEQQQRIDNLEAQLTALGADPRGTTRALRSRPAYPEVR